MILQPQPQRAPSQTHQEPPWLSLSLDFSLLLSTPPSSSCLKLKNLEVTLTQLCLLSPAWIPCCISHVCFLALSELVVSSFFALSPSTFNLFSEPQPPRLATWSAGPWEEVLPLQLHLTPLAPGPHAAARGSIQFLQVPTFWPLHILFPLHGALSPSGLIRVS